MRAAVHYVHEHPEVTFHTVARLDRIERHLRALIGMGLSVFAHRLPGNAAAEWEAEAAEEVAPLSFQWLADLLDFSTADAESAPRIES
jgi:hypothetical protein